jgi:hypothetical protein
MMNFIFLPLQTMLACDLQELGFILGPPLFLIFALIVIDTRPVRKIEYYLISYVLPNQVTVLTVEAKACEKNDENYKIVTVDDHKLLINECNIFEIKRVYEKK